MHNLYFDIAATTPLDRNIAELMTEIQNTVFGNPSSIHQFGQKSRSIVEKARRQISKSLNSKPNEIIFTSGGSESNNLVLQGLLNPGDHLITSSYEHPAIINVAKELEKKGVEVSYVKPNTNGVINSENIKKNIQDNTTLISIMYVNNELGCINPIEKIINIAKENNIKTHTDAVQLIGKGILDLNILKVDYLSIAPHKYYGPKGIGALVIRRRDGKRPPLSPLMYGGGQELGLRPGTLPVPLIVGLGKAAELSRKEALERKKALKRKRDEKPVKRKKREKKNKYILEKESQQYKQI